MALSVKIINFREFSDLHFRETIIYNNECLKMIIKKKAGGQMDFYVKLKNLLFLD